MSMGSGDPSWGYIYAHVSKFQISDLFQFKPLAGLAVMRPWWLVRLASTAPSLPTGGPGILLWAAFGSLLTWRKTPGIYVARPEITNPDA
jgi:hypothetical protein